VTWVFCAGYYSYLYARCFAASIWHRHCKENPLDLATGDNLRQGFLMHGGAKDPSKMMRDLLGDDALICATAGVRPCTEQLLADIGLVA
jgi:intermediate peptidase